MLREVSALSHDPNLCMDGLSRPAQPFGYRGYGFACDQRDTDQAAFRLCDPPRALGSCHVAPSIFGGRGRVAERPISVYIQG